MILVDTNILVYAHRVESPFHERAQAFIVAAAEGKSPWAITWNAVHEFLAVVTHPKIFTPPTPLAAAIEQIHMWFESPTLQVIGESTMSYWPTLADLLSEAKVTGAKIHDARVAAIALHHACTTLYSADRDFNRFPGVPVKNPLVGI